jgi:hypothetical protein
LAGSGINYLLESKRSKPLSRITRGCHRDEENVNRYSESDYDISVFQKYN